MALLSLIFFSKMLKSGIIGLKTLMYTFYVNVIACFVTLGKTGYHAWLFHTHSNKLKKTDINGGIDHDQCITESRDRDSGLLML